MSDFVCLFASLISSMIKICANNTGSFLKDSKIRKRSHAYESYPSTYSVKILDSLNPELQLKDIESSIKNELIDLLSTLRRFKFVTMSVLEFKKQKMINIYIYIYIASFIRTQKQKQLLMKMTLMVYLNQSILLLHQAYKNLTVSVQIGLLIQ